MTNALDRITAERVMGWAVHSEAKMLWVEAKNKDLKVLTSSDQVKGLCEGSSTWSPSRNIADTFEVVDALRAEGWRFSLGEGVVGWCATFFRRGVHGRVLAIKARDDPDRLHAILLAANAVKGVGDDEVQAAIKEGA